MSFREMKFCTCRCHFTATYRHAAPCCCSHQFKYDCPNEGCPRHVPDEYEFYWNEEEAYNARDVEEF